MQATQREVDEAIAEAQGWISSEQAQGTLVAEETLWSEAYRVWVTGSSAGWAEIASSLVYDRGRMPLNQRAAAHEACEVLTGAPSLPFAEKARKLQRIADRHDVAPWKIGALLGPGVGCPWLFPRSLWTAENVAATLEAILAPFAWRDGSRPDGEWVASALDLPVPEFLAALGERAREGSQLARMLAALRSLIEGLEREHKDPAVIETHSFVSALSQHGVTAEEIAERHRQLLALREAAVLVQSLHLYRRAEGLVRAADDVSDSDPDAACRHLERAASIYKRLSVAQSYPEQVLERHHQIWRMCETLSAEKGRADERYDHMLLISTFQSPGDLQRILLSVQHELMDFAYGRNVHLVVSDDSTGEARARNEIIFREAARSGLSVSDWGTARRKAFLARLNDEVFPDGSFDVNDLAGMRKPGEKGVPYGRLRNFLRLAALEERRRLGVERPVFTWLDQDNELGALVLTRAGTLAKRHVFNWFNQKSEVFADPRVMVGGGGYTNDALEGVEKFWVAWGILHAAMGLAQEHAPHGPAVLSPAADITRFRPWDQPDTLERLPREGESVGTISDQFLLLLNTLVGTFRGKYDNQVQIYHPWTYGYMVPGEERLVEELRPFAGMPGGNTSFRPSVLASSIPFITVPGRGEDIFHLWQVEGAHGPGTVCLTHTPALHTRNVGAGRGDLMAEIVDSFNGRIFREPPYIWSALESLLKGRRGDPVQPDLQVEEATAERIRGLRNEAMDSIRAVSGFAAEVAPYLDANSQFWWLAQAENDARCADVLSRLRDVVAEYKDVDRHLARAEDKLLGLDEVKELTQQFVAAYPHWERVVEHVGGERTTPSGATGGFLDAGPREGYGSPPRAEAERTFVFEKQGRGPDSMALGEPLGEAPWENVRTSALLLFRRYESGLAENESWLEWSERVRRLRAYFEHYSALAGDVPGFLWPTLYRDALFVPHSPPYRAMSELLDHYPAVDGERIQEVAARVGVEAGALLPAFETTPVTAES